MKNTIFSIIVVGIFIVNAMLPFVYMILDTAIKGGLSFEKIFNALFKNKNLFGKILSVIICLPFAPSILLYIILIFIGVVFSLLYDLGKKK